MNELVRALSELVGKRAWGVTLGHGSFVTLEFGSAIAVAGRSSSFTRGEWHLWITHCGWRIEREGVILAASEDDRDYLSEAVKCFEGQVLQEVEVTTAALDANFTFEDRHVLRLFALHTADYESWLLWTPSNRVLKLNAGGTWSVQTGSEPLE